MREERRTLLAHFTDGTFRASQVAAALEPPT
jgi:hypothetical protein